MHKPLITTAFCAVLLTGVIVAGPLDPPAGPIASTNKTLGEIEPRRIINDVNTPGTLTARHRIGSSGTYYLIGDVTAGDGQRGIEIAASDVTLDLNGFTLEGSGLFSPTTLDGIGIDGSRTNITIRNGTIREFDGIGIDLKQVRLSVVEDVVIVGCGADGIDAGPEAIITRCIAEGCLQGISVGTGSLVERCISRANISSGFTVFVKGCFINCISTQNGSSGFSTNGSILTGCIAQQNSDRGFSGNDSILRDCIAEENQSHGFAGESSYFGCSSRINMGRGFTMNFGGLVDGCTAQFNGEEGIWVEDESVVVNSRCTSNGLAGIRSVNNCRIERNFCQGNAVGIELASSGNIAIGNFCIDNTTNWSVAADNACHVITVATGGAFTGDAGGVPLGSSDPGVNYARTSP
ncbi:MAG: right-handed parallel beta-helix repeat-containing protein [Planctomycetota bacterium]